jgi:hypothetical protein
MSSSFSLTISSVIKCSLFLTDPDMSKPGAHQAWKPP